MKYMYMLSLFTRQSIIKKNSMTIYFNSYDALLFKWRQNKSKK